MLISLTVPCAYALSDDILATPLSVIALEDFSSGYAEVTAETTISSAYANGVISTGTGWKYLWSTTPDTYTAPVAADNINLYPLSLKKTSSSSNERFRVLKLNNLKKGTKAYRTLADDRVVKFDNIDAK